MGGGGAAILSRVSVRVSLSIRVRGSVSFLILAQRSEGGQGD